MLVILIDTANLISNERSLNVFSVVFPGDLFRFRCVRVGSSIRRNKVFSENAAI